MGRLVEAADKLFPFVLITGAIAAAFECPWLACSYCGAPTRPELTVWWGAIPGIFLAEGLTLPTGPMMAAARRIGVHALVQGFNLVVMPLATCTFCAALLRVGWLRHGIQEGLLAFSAVPTTTSMCVMHTGVAGGNAPLAAFNAVLGNTLAIFVSPMWLGVLCHVGREIRYDVLLMSLAGKMLVPLLVGQLLQGRVLGYKGAIIKGNQVFISLLVLQIFCDVFYHGSAIPLQDVKQTLICVVVLHLMFLLLAWVVGGRAGLATPDKTAYLFCSTHKTVVLGLPLLHIVFAHRSPARLARLTFPLISYHLFQLVFDLVLASRLKKACPAAPLGESLLPAEDSIAAAGAEAGEKA